MRNKGFTLIELLAVIVILSIVGLISVPLITNNINKARVSAYRSSVQNAMDAAKEYVSKNMENNDFPENGVNINSIKYKSGKFKSGIIKRDEERKIVASNVYNGKYCANGTKQNLIVEKVENEKECESIDYTAPSLKIKVVKVTNTSIMINAYGYDETSKIIGYSFKIGNGERKEVKTEKGVASYEFTNLKAGTTYEIEVEVRNENAEKTDGQYTEETYLTKETIEVKTTEVGVPTFKVSSNSYAKSKEVTITYPSIENGENSYIIKGLDTEDIEKEEKVEEQEISIDVTKNVEIIARVEYGSGYVENSINIIGIDEKGPEIVDIENSDTWERNKVLTIKVKDTGVGLATRAYSFDEGKTWIKGKDEKNPNVVSKAYTSNQEVSFWVRDKIGNITNVEDYLGGKKIVISKVDEVKPECSLKVINGTQGENGWYKSDVEVGFNSVVDKAKDAKGNIIQGSGVVYSEIYNNTTLPDKKTSKAEVNSITTKIIKDGKNIVGTGKVKDYVGNEGACSIQVNRDTKAPSKPTIINPTNGNWTNKNFSLTVSSNDEVSGIGYYQYRYGNTGWITYNNSGSNKYTTPAFSQERNELVYIRACDKAGNCSEASSTMIRIDKTAPTVPTIINPTNGNWTRGTIKVTITGSKDSMSGLDHYQYRYNGTGYTKGSSVTITTEQNRTLYAQACDKAGNCSNENSAGATTAIKIDNTKPSCGSQIGATNNWITNTDTEVGVFCSDSLSGCTQNKYTTKPSGSGLVQVNVTIKDKAGNTNTCPVTVKVDTIAPTCNGKTGGKTNWTANQDVSIGAKCYDGQSGCTSSEFTTTISGGGKTQEASITIRDKAGNTNTCKYTYNKYIDTTEPNKPGIELWHDSAQGNLTWEGRYTSGQWTNRNVVTKVTSSDTESGIDHYEYSYELVAWSPDITTIHGNHEYANNRQQLNYWITWDGSWDFYVRACDKVGNCSEASDKFTIRIDKTAPSKPNFELWHSNGKGDLDWAGRLDNNTYTTSNVLINASSLDYGTGIDHWEYMESNGGWTTNFGAYFGPMALYDNNTTLQFWRRENWHQGIKLKACDKLGNCSEESDWIYLHIVDQSAGGGGSSGGGSSGGGSSGGGHSGGGSTCRNDNITYPTEESCRLHCGKLGGSCGGSGGGANKTCFYRKCS